MRNIPIYTKQFSKEFSFLFICVLKSSDLLEKVHGIFELICIREVVTLILGSFNPRTETHLVSLLHRLFNIVHDVVVAVEVFFKRCPTKIFWLIDIVISFTKLIISGFMSTIIFELLINKEMPVCILILARDHILILLLLRSYKDFLLLIIDNIG